MPPMTKSPHDEVMAPMTRRTPVPMSHHPRSTADEWTARMARSVTGGIEATDIDDAAEPDPDGHPEGAGAPKPSDSPARRAAGARGADPVETHLEEKQARLDLEMRRERREVQRLRDEAAQLAARANELEAFLNRVARHSTAAR
jgi:hypothetical protein